MRRRVIAGALVAAVVTATGALSGGSGTYARYTDVEASPGTVGAATVVIGTSSRAPALSYTGGLLGGTSSATLTVVYTGTTPARLTLQARPAATYSSAFCTYSTSTKAWSRASGATGISMSFAGTTVDYCTLLNGGEVTLSSSVAAGSTTSFATSASFGVLSGANPRKDQGVPLLVRANGTAGPGFSDAVTGTLGVATSPSLTPRSLAVVTVPTTTAAPTTTTAPTGTPVAATDVPAECAAAGTTAASFAEKITLTADRPSFDAARDRPGSAGPFLVVGSAAADTVVGSAGGDCVTGGDGDDVVSGGSGGDVLVGGPGADRLSGEAGNDRLYGGAGVDTLDGGAGADVLDGGPDGARCTSDASDTTTGCLGAGAEGAADPTTTTSPAPTTTTPVPTPPSTTTTPPPPADTSAPAAVPEGSPDPAAPPHPPDTRATGRAGGARRSPLWTHPGRGRPPTVRNGDQHRRPGHNSTMITTPDPPRPRTAANGPQRRSR
jgi:Ca2+-binding RTX toxin-like protein